MGVGSVGGGRISQYAINEESYKWGILKMRKKKKKKLINSKE